MSHSSGGIPPAGPGNVPRPPNGGAAGQPLGRPAPTVDGRRRQKRQIQQLQAQKNIPARPHNNPPSQPGLEHRNPGTPPEANPANPALQSQFTPPAGNPSLEEAKTQLKSVIDEFWARDQLELIAKIVDNPQLAEALGCVIKVKLPNTKESVQVFPLTGKIGPDHIQRYLTPLKGSAIAALKNKQNVMPDHQLYSAYVLHRTAVFDAGRKEAHSRGALFEWTDVFHPMLQGSMTKELSDGGATFTLSRQDPNPEHAERLNQLRHDLNSGRRKRKIMPSPKHKNPVKRKTALDKPAIDLRIDASRHNIERSRASLAEQRAALIPPPPPNLNQ